MQKRKLRNIEVSVIGMGTMAFSHGYGQIPSEQYSIKQLEKHIKMVVHFLIQLKFIVQI